MQVFLINTFQKKYLDADSLICYFNHGCRTYSNLLVGICGDCRGEAGKTGFSVDRYGHEDEAYIDMLTTKSQLSQVDFGIHALTFTYHEQGN